MTCRGVPPFHRAWAARRLRPQSVPWPSCRLLEWGVAPFLAWHALNWERKLPVPGGPPLLPGSDRALWAREVCSPLPHPSHARFACAAGAGLVCPPPSCPRVVCACGQEGRVVTSPFPPYTASRGKRGLPFRGVLFSVLSWGTRAPCARWGPPSGSGGPPRGGFPCRSFRVSPPSSSLRAVVSSRWVGVPLSLPPPLGRSH